MLEEKDIHDKLVVVGGVIPARDVPGLKEMGVQGVFPGGSRFEEIVAFIRENTAPR
jgi:methylmalonyl-CoA mutase C-terminal domain/subunit